MKNWKLMFVACFVSSMIIIGVVFVVFHSPVAEAKDLVSKPGMPRPIVAKPLPVPKLVGFPSFSTSRVKRIFGGTEAQKAKGWMRSLSYLASDLSFFYGNSRYQNCATADLKFVSPGVPEPLPHEINRRIIEVYGSMVVIIDRMSAITSFLNDAFPMSEGSRYRTFVEWLREIKEWCNGNKRFHAFLEVWAFNRYEDCPRIQDAWEAYLDELERNGQTPPQDESGNVITRWVSFCDLMNRTTVQLRDIFAEKLIQIGGRDPRPIEPPIIFSE